MVERDASTIIFIDEINRILLENRRVNSKFGEEYAFFGGAIEKGETAEEALVREIREELGYSLTGYNLFRKYYVETPDISGTEYIHLAKFPGFSLVKSQEGKGMMLYPLELARNLKLLPWHYEALNELEKCIKENWSNKRNNSFSFQI